MNYKELKVYIGRMLDVSSRIAKKSDLPYILKFAKRFSPPSVYYTRAEIVANKLAEFIEEQMNGNQDKPKDSEEKV